jgi:hypothetical protein
MSDVYVCQRIATSAARWPIFLALTITVATLACVGVRANAHEHIMTLSAIDVDMSSAIVVVRGDGAFRAEQTAAEVLVEEVERRTGIRWQVTQDAGSVSGVDMVIRLSAYPDLDAAGAEGLAAEGYNVTLTKNKSDGTVVEITGADGRGVLFGVGHFLRKMNWASGHVSVPLSIEIATSPQFAVRGHQLGYRATNNTCDAWTPEQFEQYIRELAIFGSNAVENIPFPWDAIDPLMPINRREMNRRMSEICEKYDMDYWVWTPANYDLADPEVRAEAIRRSEDFYRTTPRLDDVLIPGADPGDNHPSLVIPFAEELAVLLHKYHPDAGMWISMQGYVGEKAEYFYNYLDENHPTWLAGVVAGPQAYRPVEIRKHIPPEYPVRQYPDITHTVRCQYPVPWWDLTWEMTHGREASNPRPVEYAEIIRLQSPSTNGFLAYSDGVHDDVNKVIWTALSWNLDLDTRDILVDYARVFYGPAVAERAAAGIRAFEQAWQGSALDNATIEATLLLWQQMETENPELGKSWRWNEALLRAYYDAYIYHRRRYELALEQDAMSVLAQASDIGSEESMQEATAILLRAETDPVQPALRARVEELCELLNQQIGAQTSVPKYGASGAERGAVLDFVDYPLNDRLWLNAEFTRIREMTTEQEKLERLEAIYTWSDPGPGGAYDNVGQVGMSQHIVRQVGYAAHPANARGVVPHFRGADDWKLAWKVNLHWPVANLEYVNLDPNAEYVLKVTGIGNLLPIINGEAVDALQNSTEVGEFRQFPIPKRLNDGGALSITWGDPDDRDLNWRQWSRVHEVWLLKHH